METELGIKINLYMEGGLGDHILAHRFSVKIKDKYPNSELHVFSDTENNPFQKSILSYLYPDFYSSITIIPDKKYKKCIIDSQFGQEEYRGGIHNLKNEWIDKITKSCNKWYNLHLDSLEYLNHDYDWNRDFNVIPKPIINRPKSDKKYLCFHLKSGSSQTHQLEEWYIRRLMIDSAQVFKDYHIYLIATEEQGDYYSKILDYIPNTSIYHGSAYQVCDLILSSSGGIYIDSAWRLLSRSMSLPTIDLSKDCNGYSGVPYSHRLRWLLWPNSTFGLNHSTNDIIKMLKGMLENKLFFHMPELSLTNQDQSSILIKRQYSVNKEKSILNESN